MKGAGVAALATGLMGTTAWADETPPVEVPGGTIGAVAGPDSTQDEFGNPVPTLLDSPVGSTIAGAALSGYSYRHVMWTDFTPEGPASNRAWGGYGAYAANSASLLWASLEIPAGSLIRDIEWYVINTSAADVNLLGRIWRAGTGTLGTAISDLTVPPTDGLVARRVIVPSDRYGPHPLGTKLALGIRTTVDGTVQINGARVGFTGNGAVNMLPSPVRVYDSRETGGKLTSGVTRTITLPTSIVPPGTTAIIANITVVGPESNGLLKVYPGNAAEPGTSVINYGAGQILANSQTVGISASRQIKIKAYGTTHFLVDVAGTVA